MVHHPLKQVGLKITQPRIRVLQIFTTANQRHLSAEDVARALHEAGEELSLATIYRVLTQFEAAGLLIRHHFEGGQSVFELDQGNHHDHLVCLKCSRVTEFVDEIIETRQVAIAQQAGFEMTDHCLNIYGICKQCQKEN